LFRRSWAAGVAVVLVSIAAPGLALARKPPSYHSPGYKGKTNLPRVAATPLAPITLGTGKYPDLLVDDAGTARIVFAQDGGSSSADTISYCGLQRGQARCAQTTAVPNPQEPEGGDSPGNFPAGNHDFDGPAPLVIGNQLFLVDRRFPDAFPTPDSSTSESNVFLWSSDDGGATITGPGTIGDNQIGGGATVYGGAANPSIGTISRTETGGTFFQGAGAGQYTRTKAALGTGDQAYYGELATDGSLPIATFADLSGNVFLREWSGQGDVNDANNWSETSFPGYSPQIVAGAAGVFVLYRDGSISTSNVWVRRVVGGTATGAPVKLAGPVSQPTISESPSGRFSFAYVDSTGVETRDSTDGVHFSPPQLTATVPSGHSIAHLVTAATGDGGGFVSFVKDPTGAEAVGTIVASVFGTQQATGKPGLGSLPGGGIGSTVGDQLATSTCTTAKFGVVTAQIKAGCFLHDPSNPRLDVSLGEVDINGLSIIPDAGVKIGIDPRLHTIDTSGSVSVVLKGPGINVTIWHGEIHAKIPVAIPGADLFDFHELSPPDVAGFPVSGDVDAKLVDGGVQVPISLKLPGYFGGVTGSATLRATLAGGLQLDSLEFKIGDANFGALELKNVDISYTLQGNVWKGTGTVNVPSGGSALSLSIAIEFDNGNFTSGSFDVGLPYPGVPIDLNDPPPELYLTHGGLGLGLNPVTLSGTIGFGITPLSAPGVGGTHDYIFSLDGKLSAAFGNPVTITVTATGFLYQLKLGQATLVYKIPDQVSLTGSSSFDLGVVGYNGTLSAIIDPKDNKFGGQISAGLTLHLSALGVIPGIPSDVTIPTQAIAINNTGFGVYIPPGIVPYVGTVTYHWGDAFPSLHPFSSDLSQFTAGLPAAAADRHRAHAAAGTTSFRVPANADSAAIEVAGDGGAPAIVLTAPDGKQIVPATRFGGGATAVALGDGTAHVTHVGIDHPAAGQWTVEQQPGSSIPIASVQYAIGGPPPVVSATLIGRGRSRVLRYRAKLPPNVTVSFAEQTGRLFPVIGSATRASGTIRFTPGLGSPGRRSIVAQIDNGGLPLSRKTVASYIAPGPPHPQRPRRVQVLTGAHAFAVSFTPPAGAVRTLVRVVATDGRRLQQVVSLRTRRLSVPVIGFRDGITVTVTGIGADGRGGPARTAGARRKK
jgi:hypothetical protein